MATGAAGLTAVALLFGTLDHASAQPAEGGRPALVEDAGCSRLVSGAAEVGAPSAAPDVGSVQQGLTVEVPAIAMLQIDQHGRVVAAMTNTGCAPRPEDDIYVVRSDGSVGPARSRQLVNRRWFGDFTESGVYVSQTH